MLFNNVMTMFKVQIHCFISCSAIGIGTLLASALFGVLAVAIGYTASFCVFGALTLLGMIGVCTIKGVK